MKTSANNIKFEYLHRDEGNYKIFGELIFRNEQNHTIEEVTRKLQSNLIDQEYFYPLSAKVPLFPEHKSIVQDFTDWYEFRQFSFTKEAPSAKRSIEEFLNEFST
ncbi:hypothetical protein FHG64_08395 [Antarcticibacterium flavum]|uniref:Uncharacterized protein n=1 Tax=Antarcticibacterium flavum TaxID=2058175 RepID=A0A5B7X2A7_9FLAO|nr:MULTISPECIES: hypothetical protein [Antarcticibacterium]MCM4161330.1 hypothetical protein [Antarcticibacterium sp. W02-3]QCY69410.1 hypothetical protein FHG64_08395 [Antarcticibacterium flavum]